jgi:hypothetical protein
MNMRRALPPVAVLLVALLVHCGAGSKIEKGDRLEALVELNEAGESQWDDGTVESFDCRLPKGTVLEVLYPQRTGVEFVECVPISIQGNTDPDFIAGFCLPPHLKGQPGLRGFAVWLKVSTVGTKLKRLEKTK